MKSKPTYKELEKKLEEIKLSNNLIEKSPVIRFLWKNKKNWPVEYVSENVKRIFGYTTNDFLKGDIIYRKIIHPEDLQRVTKEVIENSKSDKISFEHKPYRIISKKGKIKWVNDITIIRRNKNREITHYEGIIIDITKQKQSEEKLIITRKKVEESEDKYKILLTNTLDTIWTTDLEFNITYISNAIYDFLGYRPEEFIGLHPSIFTNTEGMNKLKNLAKQLFSKYNEGKIVQLKSELRQAKKNGEVIDVEIMANILQNRKKEFIGFQGRSVDITERKKSEKKLRLQNIELIKAKKKAEESNKLKTEFINNMSHEIRTPMNGIIGFSNFLNKSDLTNQERKQYINIIQSSGRQLIRIIDDILEISKLGTRQVKVIEKQICLNNLLLELFAIFEIKAKENKTPLYLKKGRTDKESIIITDEIKLKKILGSLLENALKFTNKGFIELGYNIVNIKNELPLLQIYVKDTGIGIKPENKEMIFVRFSQEEKGLSRKAGGLGLGLSISKENAELLGGKITLKSEKGKGTTFYVTIPYKPVNSKTDNSI